MILRNVWDSFNGFNLVYIMDNNILVWPKVVVIVGNISQVLLVLFVTAINVIIVAIDQSIQGMIGSCPDLFNTEMIVGKKLSPEVHNSITEMYRGIVGTRDAINALRAITAIHCCNLVIGAHFPRMENDTITKIQHTESITARMI